MGIRSPKTRNRIFSSESVFTVLFALVTVFACEFEEPIPTYTLTTSVSPNEGGKITRSPELPNYKAGDVVTLTLSPMNIGCLSNGTEMLQEILLLSRLV